ncbi:MAG: DUF2892 domain-containing protein [Halioglobus sp.]|nr:DUF2892 domain-containing protein [Halioglobus sp.]
MIERNLGNFERVVRFLLGVVFAMWALSQPAMNVIEWFVTFVSLALILNGIFSRCYVWYLLDIDTTQKGKRSPSTTIC